MAYIVFSGEGPKVLSKVEALDEENIFQYYINISDIYNLYSFVISKLMALNTTLTQFQPEFTDKSLQIPFAYCFLSE